jgi:CheY-like chemotaxis protein
LKATPVCVVDGSAVVIARLGALLEQAALADAVFFTDPLPALEWCLAERPSLVLVDDAMPGLGGLAFMGKLRVGAPGGDAVVALLSSHASGPVVGQLRSLAALTRRRQRDWAETISRASALVRRALCKEPDVVLPALHGCALAYGLQPAQCDGLEDAWHLLQASSPAAPSQSEHADACGPAAGRSEALRLLALTERDRSAREAESVAGAGTGAGQADAARWAAQMLLYGNEHWDGSGGPLGLRGADIPVPARLFHLVNSYGLLRAAAAAGGATLAEAHALRLVQAWSGAEFDPEMVAGLCRSADCSTAACAP